MISIQTCLGQPGEFRPMAEWSRPSEVNHVKGAIVMRTNGVEIMGFEEWDDVNWLWPFMVNMLEEIEGQPVATTYFPDQPLLLKFVRRPPGEIRVELSHNSVVHSAAQTDLREFLSMLDEAGCKFFTHLAEIIPEESAHYRRECDRLRAVVSRLSASP